MSPPSTAEESKHISEPSTVKKALYSFELLGNPNLVMQCHISKDLKSQSQKLLYQGKQVQM